MSIEKSTQPDQEGHIHADPSHAPAKEPTEHDPKDRTDAAGEADKLDPKADREAPAKEPTDHDHQSHTHAHREEHHHKGNLFISGENHVGHDWGLGNK